MKKGLRRSCADRRKKNRQGDARRLHREIKDDETVFFLSMAYYGRMRPALQALLYFFGK